MEQSIEIALRNSLKLSVAQEGLQSAAFQRKEAATAFLPKMSTSYGYTRLHDDPGFYFQGFPPWIPAGWMKTGTKDNYQWNLEARQPLFAGGGLLAQYQVAKIAEDIARVEEGAVIQQIVLEVKIAYFQILQARRLQETAKQSVEMLSAHLETARYFYQVGLSAKTDVLQAEVELANAKQAFQRAQNAVELANARFNILLRREISEPVSITDTLIDRPLAPPL
jgi:outer membrane protein